MIDIIEPRWHDRTVLVAKYKVKRGRNLIKIMGGAAKGVYETSQIALASYPVESNGVIACYAIPLDKLERIK